MESFLSKRPRQVKIEDIYKHRLIIWRASGYSTWTYFLQFTETEILMLVKMYIM